MVEEGAPEREGVGVQVGEVEEGGWGGRGEGVTEGSVAVMVVLASEVMGAL